MASSIPETDIKEYLQQFRDYGLVHLYAHPGNAGDAVILAGTLQLFDAIGIRYQLIHDTHHFKPEGQTVFYSGGGYLVNYYPEATSFIENNHQKLKRLVILPHTINANEKMLARLGTNVDILAREKYTYRFLKENAPKCNVYLARDMAFMLDTSKLMSYRLPTLAGVLLKKIYWKITGNPKIKEVPSPGILLKSKTAELKSSIYRASHSNRKLYCFRDDPEKTGIPLPKDNLDVSRIYKQEIGYLPLVYYSASKMTRLINKYDEIYTNRLHAAIIGALLGKKTYFYPNSYYKNQAVYEHSLKDHYPSVTWMGQ